MASLSSFEPDHDATDITTTERDVESVIRPLRKRARRRRVRLSYPAPFVQLAVALQERVGVRRTAGMLGLQLSTIYRWSDRRKPPTGSSAPIESNHKCPSDLAVQCSASGFPIDDAVLVYLPEMTRAATREVHTEVSAIGRTDQSSTLAIRDDATDKILHVKRLLDERFGEPWSCAELARHCGMSRLNFIRRFARRIGVPPYRYLINIRIERARQLLAEPNRLLANIARDVGFGSVSSMQRAFYRYLGVSPAKLSDGGGISMRASIP